MGNNESRKNSKEFKKGIQELRIKEIIAVIRGRVFMIKGKAIRV